MESVDRYIEPGSVFFLDAGVVRTKEAGVEGDKGEMEPSDPQVSFFCLVSLRHFVMYCSCFLVIDAMRKCRSHRTQ